MSYQDKANAGLLPRWFTTRTDGSSAPGGKHHECECFVLDLTHDPFAAPALLEYAVACEAHYPRLSKDLVALVERAVTGYIASKFTGRMVDGRLMAELKQDAFLASIRGVNLVSFLGTGEHVRSCTVQITLNTPDDDQ